MNILVIIPAYNEENSIVDVVTKLEKDNPDVDYIVVNDCSKDSTRQLLQENNIRYLDLRQNLGIGGAVQSGYKYALENDYDIAIQLDGDGQHDSSFIGDLVKPIQDNLADIVIGSRFIDKEGFQSTLSRRMGISLLSSLIKLCCGIKINDVTSGFRAVNKKYIGIYSADYPSDYPEPEAIVQAAMKHAVIREVPVIMQERSGGKSSIFGWKTLYYMVKVSIAIIISRISEGN